MIIKKSDYKRIKNEITAFNEYVYTNNYTVDYLHKQTGISKYQLNYVLKITNSEDDDNTNQTYDVNDTNAEKLNKLLPKLNQFIKEESSVSNYKKLNSDDFFKSMKLYGKNLKK